MERGGAVVADHLAIVVHGNGDAGGACGAHKLGPGVDLQDLQADRAYEPYAPESRKDLKRPRGKGVPSRRRLTARPTLLCAVWSPPTQREDRMAGFTFKLEHEDGTPADPPTFRTAVPNWRAWRHDSVGPRQGASRD
jgi:hypothetical protein